jgi:hypothetical protein
VKAAPSLRSDGAVHLVGGHLLEAAGHDLGRVEELVGDHGRVLAGVVVGERRGVLVPVREGGGVLGEHQHEAAVEDAEHVPHVRRVLERRPGRVVGSLAHVVASQLVRPGGGVRADEARHVAQPHPCGVVAALAAGLVEHPGPVLRVGDDRHGPTVASGRGGARRRSCRPASSDRQGGHPGRLDRVGGLS